MIYYTQCYLFQLESEACGYGLGSYEEECEQYNQDDQVSDCSSKYGKGMLSRSLYDPQWVVGQCFHPDGLWLCG